MKSLLNLRSILKTPRISLFSSTKSKLYSTPSQFSHEPSNKEKENVSTNQMKAAIPKTTQKQNQQQKPSKPNHQSISQEAQHHQMLLMVLQSNHIDVTHGPQTLTFIESFFQKRDFEFDTLESEGQQVTPSTNLKQVTQTMLLFATLLRLQKTQRGRSTCITMLFQAIESVVAKPFLFDKPNSEPRKLEDSFYSASDLEQRFAQLFKLILPYPDTPVALLCHNLIIDFHLQFNPSVLRIYEEISKLNTEEKYGSRYTIYKAFACYLYSSYLLKHKVKVLESDPSLTEAEVEQRIISYFDMANKLSQIGGFHSLRSVWYGNHHQFEKSLEHIQEAIVLEPTNPDFMLLQSDFYIQIPDFEKAIQSTQRALKFATLVEEQIPIYAKQTSLLVWSLQEATLKKVIPNVKVMLDLILSNGLSKNIHQISGLLDSMFLNQIPTKVKEKHPEIENPYELVMWLHQAVEALVNIRFAKEDASQRNSCIEKATKLLQTAKQSAESLKQNTAWKFGDQLWQNVLSEVEMDLKKLNSTPSSTPAKKKVYTTDSNSTSHLEVQHEPKVQKKYTLPKRVNYFSKLFTTNIKSFKDYKGELQSIRSHQLLVQAGFIRQCSSGIYHYLPMGTRVMQKITNIIDEELQACGNQKVVMPLLLDSDLWKITQRWDSAGEELIRVKDRKDHYFCLAPTHEEAVTSLVAAGVSSHLPVRIYQIGTKFRDELRPRFGLMRGKEFVMKDAYSFDTSKEAAFQTYDEMAEAYCRIFDRMELNYAIVEADSGNIGGSRSHEFQVKSEVGEDVLLTCPCGKYAANIEKAIGSTVPLNTQEARNLWSSSIENWSGNVDTAKLGKILEANHNRLKYVILEAVFKQHVGKERIEETRHKVLCILHKSETFNPLKVKSLFNAYDVENITVHEEKVPIIQHISHLLIDFSTENPVEIRQQIIDAGASTDTATNPNITLLVGDFREAKQGDYCIRSSFSSHEQECVHGPLKKHAGIEVGHIFYLGTKYSKPFQLECTNPVTQDKQLVEMGCYGIGVSRVMQVIVENSNDKDGIIWPQTVAPYKLALIPLHISAHEKEQNEKIVQSATELYSKLEERFPALRNEIMFDDRYAERPPVKLKDAAFIGYPFVVVMGKEYVNNSKFEVQIRKTNQKLLLTQEQLFQFFEEQLL